MTNKQQDDERNIFGIDNLSLFEEYCSNKELRKRLDRGHFVFVEPGYLVIDNPQYVSHTDNGPVLTSYAKEHLSECCLCFEESATKRSKTLTGNSRRKAAPAHNPAFDRSHHNMKVFSRSEELCAFYNDLINDGLLAAKSEFSFAQFAEALIHDKQYNKLVFAEKTGLSIRTYNRIMKNDLSNPTLQTVMAICIGLQLRPELSERLLEKAGFRLNTSFLHLAYRKLLTTYIGHSIEACNELLVALGLPPL